MNKWGNKEGSIRNPNALAISSDGRLHILDEYRSIKTYGPRGKYLSSISFEVAYSDLKRGKDDNLILVDTNGFSVIDQQNNLLGSYYGSTLGNPSGLCQDSKGRFYIADSGNHKIIAFNPSSIYNSSRKTGNLKVKSVITSGLEVPYAQEANVYIEGTDPEGITFFGVGTLERNGVWNFINVPLGSRYKIWTDDNGFTDSTLKNHLSGE